MSSARLEKQVEKLEAELKEKKAQISREKRKERGGQLEAKLLAYRFGEPKQQMELSGSVQVPNIVVKEYVARD